MKVQVLPSKPERFEGKLSVVVDDRSVCRTDSEEDAETIATALRASKRPNEGRSASAPEQLPLFPSASRTRS